MAFNSDKIIWGLSDIKDGPMKYDFANQQNFFEKIKLGDRKIIGADLRHGNNIIQVNNQTAERVIPECDALITDDPDYLLTITVADCLPIYFYDSQKQIVALAHAGWKGALNNIAAKTVLQLIKDFNSQAADIQIFIGPHIQTCHFEVKDDVASQFSPQYLEKRAGQIFVNLAAAVKDQLLAFGINNDNILISSDCTYCQTEKYFSFRRERDKMVKALVAYIGLK